MANEFVGLLWWKSRGTPDLQEGSSTQQWLGAGPQLVTSLQQPRAPGEAEGSLLRPLSC